MIEIEEQQDQVKVHIRVDMTIYQVRDLKEALAPIYRQEKTLDIDMSAVDGIDTSGVQLLLLLKKARAALGYTTGLSGLTSEVEKTFEFLGLMSNFSDVR